MERDEFDAVVRNVVKGLPRLLRRKLDNVDIVIEEDPIAQAGLLGLYQGVPLKHRGVWYGNVLPDRITLFKANIERLARRPEDVAPLIADVLIHEIGHHLGFDEETLRELGIG